MRDLLLELVPWGIEVIIRIQDATGGPLDAFFRLMSDLGSQYAYLLLVAALYWAVDKRLAARLALLYLSSSYVNGLIKGLAMIERPFVVSPEVVARDVAGGYAFPSGHAQLAATVWPSLAYVYRRRWLLVLAVVMVLLISFSRIYLGVHYPQDAIGGITVGLLWAALYRVAYPWVEQQLADLPLGVLVAGLLIAPVLATLSLPASDTLPVAGSAIGLGLGYVFEERWIGLSVRADPWRALWRLVVGTVLTAGVFLILGAALPWSDSAPLAYASVVFQYGASGATATLLAPWAFAKLGLATPRGPRDVPVG